MSALSISLVALTGLCLASLRKRLWCRTDRQRDTQVHTLTYAHTCIPDASLDWATWYSRSGFSAIFLCHAGSVMNLSTWRDETEGFGINCIKYVKPCGRAISKSTAPTWLYQKIILPPLKGRMGLYSHAAVVIADFASFLVLASLITSAKKMTNDAAKRDDTLSSSGFAWLSQTSSV